MNQAFRIGQVSRTSAAKRSIGMSRGGASWEQAFLPKNIITLANGARM
jgi:hypothetical protein